MRLRYSMAALLCALVFGPIALAQEQRDPPWALLPTDSNDCRPPAGTAVTAASQYEFGVALLEKDRPETLAVASECFRRAIDSRPASGEFTDGASQKPVVYFPYFRLAQIYVQWGQIVPAEKCLAREDKERLRTTRLKKSLEQLESKLRLQRKFVLTMGYAAESIEWGLREGLMRLRGGAEATKEITATYRKIQADKADLSNRLINRLESQLIELFKNEAGARRDELERLGEDRFQPAFVGAPLPRESVCEIDSDDVTRAHDQLLACDKANATAWTSATRYICDRVPDPKPNWCLRGRNPTSIDKLEEQLARVPANPSNRQGSARNEPIAIVIPNPQCTLLLGVEAKVSALESLRDAAQADGDASGIAKRIEEAQTALGVAIRDGAKSYVQPRCDQVPAESIKKLRDALDAWSSEGVTAGQITNLCSLAGDVKALAERNCATTQAAPELVARAKSLVAPVALAGAWRKATRDCAGAIELGLASDALDCVDAGASRLRRAVALTPEQAGAAREKLGRELTETSACLSRVISARQAWRSALKALLPSVKRGGALETVRVLIDVEPAPRDSRDLRNQLDNASLQLEASDLIALVDQIERPRAEILELARDTAIARQLAPLCGELAESASKSEFGPARGALSNSFHLISRGEIERAVVELRAQFKRGDVFRSARETYLAHATLAYLLHLSAALAREEDSRRLYLDDMRHEAKLAALADASATLPVELFPEAFRRAVAGTLR